MTTDDQDDAEDTGATGEQRLDKWLWYARMAKTRSLAQRLIADGQVRVNRDRITKPSQTVKLGDLITVSLGRQLRLLKLTGFGLRRGPAPEAAQLYEDLAPPAAKSAGKAETPDAAIARAGLPQRAMGSGRPTKRDRRRMDKLLGD